MTVLGAGHHAHGLLGSSSVAATPIWAVPPPSSELEDLKMELKDQKTAFEGLKMQHLSYSCPASIHDIFTAYMRACDGLFHVPMHRRRSA